MASSKSRNNVVLTLLVLLFFSVLSLCTNPEKQNIKKYNLSPRSNRQWHRGRLLIGHKTEQDGKSKEATGIDMDYQSDMGPAWEFPMQKMLHENGFPEYDNTAVERLLKMNPIVDCSGGHMRLQVKDADSKPGALLFVDRGDLPPLSLSKLPRSCGYKVSSTRRDFVMVAPYDACFVLVTEFCYVLPLLWLGLPVQMSCPLSLPSETLSNTPMVTCLPGKMVITDWMAQAETKVHVHEKWEPLMQVIAKCDVTVKPSPFTIMFPYKPPCVKIKDGMYTVKLSGDVDVEVSCPPVAPPVAPTDSSQLMMDFGQSTTPVPTQPVKTTPQALEDDVPTGDTYDQSSWYKPAYTGSPFYPMHPEGGTLGLGHYPYMFQPEHPPRPGSPSVDMHPPLDPMWYWSEPHSLPPFYVPPETEQPKPSPQPTTPSPTYPCPFYHSTPKPKVTTASPSVTIPQHYQPFRPYYYQYTFPYLPHSTTTPTPFTQKPQKPPNSRPGAAVVFPKHPHPELKQPIECLQYCHLGLPDCCAHISFHQHHYHFVPQQQKGNLRFPLLPLPGQPTVLIPSQSPPEAPAPPRRITFTNAPSSPQLYPSRGLHGSLTYHRSQEDNPAALPGNMPREQTESVLSYSNSNAFFHRGSNAFHVNPWKPLVQQESPSTESPVTKAPVSPQLYSLGGQQGWLTYHQPQEGNPAASPGNKPSDQTNFPPASFNQNSFFHWYPSTFDINQWKPQVQPEGASTGAPAHIFSPAGHGSNIFAPYDEHSSHQSDGPPSNAQTVNNFPNIGQYGNLAPNSAKVDVTEPALVFRSRQNPFVHHNTVPEQPLPDHQPSDALKTPNNYVLLQHGPPGRKNDDTIPRQPYSPVVSHQNVASSFLNKPQNLKAESEGPKRLEGSDKTDQTAGDKPGSLLQSASAGSYAGPLFQEPISGQYLKYSQTHFSHFGPQRRTLQPDMS